MTIVSDLISRADELSSQRIYWERVWREVADLCLPMAERIRQQDTGRPVYDALPKMPESAERGRKIYDSTSVWAVDRLAAGIESLATPSTQRWHGAAIDDPLAPEPTDEESEWLDKLADYHFAARYDPRSGFQIANQLAIKATVSLGTGVVFVEETTNGSRSLPARYRYIPLSENYLATNQFAECDTNFRRFTMTARQMVQKWGDKVSGRVKAAYENPKDKDREFGLLHAVCPRDEKGSRSNTNRGSAFASYYVEEEERHLIGDGGFFEFPFIVYQWNVTESGAYGESPVMIALADIKTLQAASKDNLRAIQQYVRPPLAISNDGVMNRPNLNSGAINQGAVDTNGRLKIQPIYTVQNPSFADLVLEQKRNAIRESLYINLFQILIANPEMTATEALIRAQEKGELLGPAGARIQMAMSRMFDREFGIYERKGAFDPGSALAPPESLQGRSIGVKFTSPLDRLRRANEAIGIQRTLEIALPMVQADPSVMDNFDFDEIVRTVREINGAPADILRRREEVDQVRQGRAQQQAMLQNLAAAKEAAVAGKDAASGVESLARAGAVNGAA